MVQDEMGMKCREDFEREYPLAKHLWIENYGYGDDKVAAAWNTFQVAWLCGYAASIQARSR